MQTPREIRADVMEEFREFVGKHFGTHEELQSVMLCVAQYWDDEADDAVHAEFIFSKNQTPAWPHICTGYEDEDRDGAIADNSCSGCREAFSHSWMNAWSDNYSAVDGFAAYCKENSNQEMEVADAYLPYAIARKTPDGVDIEIVGKVLRPWLDEEEALSHVCSPQHEIHALLDLVYASPDDDSPRHVLADLLQELGDPRGEFIALDLLKESVDVEARNKLLREHGAKWLGLLSPVVSTETVLFERGFPCIVDASFASEEVVARCGDDPAWATITDITFEDPNFRRQYNRGRRPLVDLQYLSNAMVSLTRLRNVERSGLTRLASMDFTLPIEYLSTSVESNDDLGTLLSIKSLPLLEELQIYVHPAVTIGEDPIERVWSGSWADSLCKLVIRAGALPPWIVQPSNRNVEIRAYMERLWITVTPNQRGEFGIVECTMPRIRSWSDAAAETIGSMLSQLPRVELLRIRPGTNDGDEPQVPEPVDTEAIEATLKRLHPGGRCRLPLSS